MKKVLLNLSLAASLAAVPLAVQAQSESKDCIVAVYENNVLYSCANGVYEDGTVYADVKLPSGGYTAKAFFGGDKIENIADGMLKLPTPSAKPTLEPTATPSVEPTAKPTQTAAPTTEPSAAPTEKPTRHPAYDSAKAAVEAFAVVDKVSIVSGADGENKTQIDVLYQGEKRAFVIDNDVVLSSAPVSCIEMTGADMMSLKKGDVIVITCYPSGDINRIDMVMRPPKDDILTSGEYGSSFEQLVGIGGYVGERTDWSVLKFNGKVPTKGTQYAFGIVREKDGSSVVLINGDGLDKDALYIDMHKDAIVYTCDVSDKNELDIGGVSSIVKSDISKSDKDDDDNVISWDEKSNYTYALVRISDGEGVEMITYRGYKD